MTSGRLFLLLLLILAGGAVAVWQGLFEVPPRWNPWAPLDIREPPNLLTRYKLMRLQGDRALCDQALATSRLNYQAVDDVRTDSSCPIENAVRVRGSQVGINASFLATCRLAAAFALFERHGLQQAARQVYGQPVVRIDHFGSFACRNIANSDRRSQHASANALDVAGFRLRDGTRITLARDWNGSDKEQRFLRLVRQTACRSFNGVLSPDYNAAHRDHLHLDMGGYRMCR